MYNNAIILEVFKERIQLRILLLMKLKLTFFGDKGDEKEGFYAGNTLFMMMIILVSGTVLSSL